MSMLLSIAIDQIQKPSWWPSEEPVRKGYRESPTTVARREAIVEYTKQAKRKVTTDELMEKFGLSRMQVRWAMEKPVKQGLIIQHKPRHDYSLWEAAKWA